MTARRVGMSVGRHRGPPSGGLLRLSQGEPMGRRLIFALLSAAVVSGALAGQATAGSETELGASLSRLVNQGAPGATIYVRRGRVTTRVARGLSVVAGRRPM